MSDQPVVTINVAVEWLNNHCNQTFSLLRFWRWRKNGQFRDVPSPWKGGGARAVRIEELEEDARSLGIFDEEKALRIVRQQEREDAAIVL